MKKDKQSRRLFAKTKSALLKHRIVFLIIAGILIIAIGASTAIVVASNLNSKTKPVSTSVAVLQPDPDPEPTPEPPKYYSPLTGNLVRDEASINMPVTGVMIENSPDARPQSGLKNSGVVFEAIAEGGITRFLVLYQNEKPQLIGPVRSLRLYDVDWLAAFNAGIAHVGGSANALTEIRNGKYRDLDQFFNANYYWRASDRYAPHNVYTSFDKLDALNAAKGFTSSSFTGFDRTEAKPSATPDALKINVNISSNLFNSSYTYNPSENNYARSQNNAPHLDREDGQITPSSIVVMNVNETTVMEDGWRENITTIGSDIVHIFQNGTVTTGTWHKSSKTNQIYFLDSDNNRIALVPGQTWISAIPNGKGSVTWK